MPLASEESSCFSISRSLFQALILLLLREKSQPKKSRITQNLAKKAGEKKFSQALKKKILLSPFLHPNAKFSILDRNGERNGNDERLHARTHAHALETDEAGVLYYVQYAVLVRNSPISPIIYGKASVVQHKKGGGRMEGSVPSFFPSFRDESVPALGS